MIGRNCKRLRQRAGLTQEDLAERLHVTRQAVSAWETEKNKLDAETLTVLAQALDADVRELLYGPGAVEECYARHQKRYLVSTAVCALLVIAWLVMAVVLEPYLAYQTSQTLDPSPSMTYGFTVPALGIFALGALIPSFASLWVDIRVPSVTVRRVLLVLGLLALGYYLFWVAWYLGLWPSALANWEPLWNWVITLSMGNYKLFRLGPLFLSGGFLFLSLNR